MATSLEPTSPSAPQVSASPGPLVERGADLVYLAESFFLGLFRLALGLTILGSLVSILFAAVSTRGITWITVLYAAVSASLAVLALAKPSEVYFWLRRDAARQLLPLLLAGSSVLINGPASPSWWLALPLLWVIATVSSTRLSLLAACVTAAAYLAGTALDGETLVLNGNAGVPAGAVALAGNTLICRLVAELLVRFILRLYQVESAESDDRPPLRVPNLVARSSAVSSDPGGSRPSGRPPRLTRLSSRELEVALLLRDGLKHREIAEALGITSRQVERLLERACARVRADSPAELLAMLVTGRLVPLASLPGE